MYTINKSYSSKVFEKYNLTKQKSPSRNKEALYEKMEQNPQDYMILAALGETLIEDGEANNAVLYLEKAIQLKNNDAKLYAQLANSKNLLGKHEEAIFIYKSALQIDPHDKEIQSQYSRAMTRFVPTWHFGMLADEERNKKYYEAIKKYVNADSVVLDIGTGSGLLSLMAAKAGAKKVYTCEQSVFVAEAAKSIIKANGYEDKITLFPDLSTKIMPYQFEEKPNLIIGEIFDGGLLGEHAIPSYRDAKQRLGTEDCQILPGKARVVGRLIYAPRLAQVSPLKSIEGFDLSIFDQFRIRTDYAIEKLSTIEHQFISKELEILTIDFNSLASSVTSNESTSQTIEIDIEETGKVNAFAFWFHLDFGGNITLSSAPERKDNHWGQAIMYFENHKLFQKGEKVSITMTYHDTYLSFKENW